MGAREAAGGKLHGDGVEVREAADGHLLVAAGYHGEISHEDAAEIVNGVEAEQLGGLRPARFRSDPTH